MTAATLKVRVIPRGSRNEIVGWRGDALCVKVTSPPIEGLANEALVKFLADILGVATGYVRILSGQRNRYKLISVTGLTEDEIKARLLRHLAER